MGRFAVRFFYGDSVAGSEVVAGRSEGGAATGWERVQQRRRGGTFVLRPRGGRWCWRRRRGGWWWWWWMVMVEDGAAVPRAFWLADSVQEKRAQVKSLLVEDCPSSCR